MMNATRTLGLLCIALAAGGAALSAPPRALAQAAASVTPAPVKKPELPLDVEALKTRLRETKAIGFFTKLELQNQMNDLLQQFRERYKNGQNQSVAALRQPFDMLVLKVLALVQDGDPPLARTILQSREAIWNILADPEKFKSVS
jgi:hypothetical protein